MQRWLRPWKLDETAPLTLVRRRVLTVLGLGFAVVVLLLGGVAYLAVESAELWRASAANLAREHAANTAVLAQVQRSQAALRLVVFRVIQDPIDLDEQRIQALLKESRSELDQALDGVRGTILEDYWADYQRRYETFIAEIERAFSKDFPRRRHVARLFERQEEVFATLRRFVTSSHEVSLATQQAIEGRSGGLRTRAYFLLGGCLLAAAIASFFSVRTVTGLLRELERQSDELAVVSARMLEQQEAAAQRFSHELHDELGQTLAAVKANLAALSPAAPDFERRREDCLALASEAIRNVRELSQLLHPTILDHFGLAGGLRWLAEGFMGRTGIEVSFENDFDGQLPDETRTHLFRIAQEALTNIARHSAAKRVTMRLEAADGSVRLTVEDDGQGFDPSTDYSGLGLVGMRARAKMAGGGLRVKSSEGNGLEIEVTVPAAGRPSAV